MKSLLLFLTTISVFSSYTSAQSQFIEDGGFGAMFFATAASTEYGNSVGGGLGVSIAGRVDLGFTLGKSSAGNVNKEVSSGHISIFLSKSKANFALDLGYMSGVGSSNVMAGFTFSKNFNLSKEIQLQPSCSYHLTFISGTSSTPPASAFGISLDFLFIRHFIVSPNLGSVNNTMFGGLSFGLLFGN